MRLNPNSVYAVMTMTPPTSWKQRLPALELLAQEPALLEAIVRQAMAETLLVAYRERYLARIGDAIRTERVKRGTNRDRPQLDDVSRERYIKAVEALVDARRRGNAEEIYDAGANVYNIRQRLVEALQRQEEPRRSFPTGRLRSMALKLLADIANVSAIQSQSSGGIVRLGIGHIPTLDQIETPSATPDLTGHPTTSSYKVLWKHLEFGTGVFAQPQGNAGSPYRLPGGGWSYGGLWIKGSRGLHALRNPRTGLPYQAESMRFKNVFAALMAKALGFQ